MNGCALPLIYLKNQSILSMILAVEKYQRERDRLQLHSQRVSHAGFPEHGNVDVVAACAATKQDGQPSDDHDCF
jgi:hypothetical protein